MVTLMAKKLTAKQQEALIRQRMALLDELGITLGSPEADPRSPKTLAERRRLKAFIRRHGALPEAVAEKREQARRAAQRKAARAQAARFRKTPAGRAPAAISPATERTDTAPDAQSRVLRWPGSSHQDDGDVPRR
jgi:hypothetical protein